MDETENSNEENAAATEPVVENAAFEQKIESVKVEDEMQKSYLDYSMSVIVGRSLPDARDGMKPVHRRSIFTMRKMGNVHNQPHMKSARVVGEVMGKYHPHGDSSIYDTIVRLAQPFAMRLKLVDGHGNFGNIDGYGAAASRYTEVRMCELAEDLCEDMEKDTVDMVPNYSGDLEEPTVLPAKIPNLLLNGSSGIAVGMATNIPTHNLGELLDAVKFQVDNPQCTVHELMHFIKGPDFPTGAIICGRSAIEQMYTTGRASLKVRAKAEIVTDAKGREQIIVTEIPYGVVKKQMLAHIGELLRDKMLEGISDVKDFSKGDMGVHIVFTVKQDAQADVVLNHLYRLTELQSSFPANMLALDHGTPRRMSLKLFLKCFIDHRVEVITRRTRYLLAKAEERKHILEGFRIAIDNIDEVVHIIRSSQNDDDAKARLLERFGLDDAQSSAILEMKLRQLTGLQRDKIEEEYRQLVVDIERYKAILANPQMVLDIIKADCDEIKAKYCGKDPRRTEIREDLDDISANPLDYINKEACIITLSNRNYVKRCPLAEFKAQHKGGKGRIGARVKDNDFVKRVYSATTHDKVLYFTSYGRVFSGMVYQVPEADQYSFGKPLINVLRLDPGVPEGTKDSYGEPIPAKPAERVLNIIVYSDFNDTQAVFFATKKGVIKKTVLQEYRNVNRNGIRAIGIADDDELVGVELVEKGDEMFLVSANGQSLHFKEDNVRVMGRTAHGVRGMRLAGVTFGAAEQDEGDEGEGGEAGEQLDASLPADEIRALVKVDKDPDSRLLLMVENGFGVLTRFDAYTTHKRGGKGMKSIKTGGRNGKVVFAASVNIGPQAAEGAEGAEPAPSATDDEARRADDILVITAKGQLIRTSVAAIRECGRGAAGVRIVRVADDDAVVSAAVTEGAAPEAPAADASAEEATAAEEKDAGGAE